MSRASSDGDSLDRRAQDIDTVLTEATQKQTRQDPRDAWRPIYEMLLGIKPGSKSDAGIVMDAICKFCARFGREEAKPATGSQNAAQIAGILASPKKRRKKTKKPGVFTSFRIDNIKSHLKTQHSKRWEEYNALPKDEKVRAKYFIKEMPISSYLTQPSFEVRVPAGVMALLKCLYFDDGHTSLGPQFIECDNGDCIVQVADRDQFEVIVECISNSVSYRSTSELFVVFGMRLMNMKLGKPTEKVVRDSVRLLTVINLTAFAEIFKHVWGFSIIVDGATHQERGYLDVRLSFGLDGALHNFHFLAIPTGTLSHTGKNYAALVLTSLKALGGDAALQKLIGISSDGAANMLGCNNGFSKNVKDACRAVGGTGIVTNWCGSHQLNLVMNQLLMVFDSYVDFRSTLGSEISFTHTHESVKQRVGSCPHYAETRWDSIYESCKFLTLNRNALVALQKDKDRSRSSRLWWIVLAVVTDLARSAKLCFEQLQYKHVTVSEQYAALKKLATTHQNRFEENDPDGKPCISDVKTEFEICKASAFSGGLYEKLDVPSQFDLILVVRDAVQEFIDGVLGITFYLAGMKTDLPGSTVIR
ncbi:hypothetical protein PF007_g8826 [Phytophthora fragariae]|uniref:DUF4371 domain-containing protein n=1 Tax=Phytophthora fragariae TaxID=53985 RepID=A0A6A3SKP5_9STRA|nr:hypothetical protein PF007_g8826 [Phytophthora fragariae]